MGCPARIHPARTCDSHLLPPYRGGQSESDSQTQLSVCHRGDHLPQFTGSWVPAIRLSVPTNAALSPPSTACIDGGWAYDTYSVPVESTVGHFQLATLRSDTGLKPDHRIGRVFVLANDATQRARQPRRTHLLKIAK